MTQAMHTSIIRPNVDWTGKFRTEDERYQMINWTNTFRLVMDAMDENGMDVHVTVTGLYDDLIQMYEMNKDGCYNAVLYRICILGDGSIDLSCVKYNRGHAGKGYIPKVTEGVA